MLDDHTTDSNHKKMLSMTVRLCSKSCEAMEILAQLGNHHVELMAAFGQQAIERWEEEVTRTELLRIMNIKVMDMYGTQGSASVSSGSGRGSGLGLGLALIQSAVEEWIDFAIIFEQMQ
jgi:hypothetical protein